jgi:sialate O-acetylesterase
MVLQRAPQSAKIWGWSTVSDKVNLTLIDAAKSSEFYEATSGADGKWFITLSPKQAGGPYNIVVRGVGQLANMTDVLFGDVYWCSGQSNMEYSLSSSFNGTAAAAVAGNYTNIRLIRVPRVVAPVPYDMWSPNPVVNGTLRWVVASTSAVSSFSAVCWWNAVHMSDELNNTVPIGLIGNYWGGTAIERWLSPQVYNASGCAGQSSAADNKATIFNVMVYPFIPIALKSMYWYQGEANGGAPDYYKCILPQFVEDYRTLFDSDMPFTFVQLAPINYTGDYWPRFRAMQHDAYHLIDQSCLVSTTDLGDLDSGGGPIHPRVKEPIGYRSYLCTRKLVYGKSGVWNGPLPLCATASNTTNEITVSFVKDTVGNSLIFKEPYCPASATLSICGLPWSVNNGTAWYNATFTMSEDKTQVILSGNYIISNQSSIQIRYAWGAYSQATLYNSANVASPVFQIKLSECPIDPPVEPPVEPVAEESPGSSNTPSTSVTANAVVSYISLPLAIFATILLL